MASLRDLFITFALIGLFTYAAISFIVTTQTDNRVSNTILEDDVINKTHSRLETSLGEFSSNTSTQKESVEGDIPERGFGSLLIFSIVPALWSFGSLVVGVYNIIIVLPASLLGVHPAVIGVLSSILIISLVLWVWSVIRIGR